MELTSKFKAARDSTCDCILESKARQFSQKLTVNFRLETVQKVLDAGAVGISSIGFQFLCIQQALRRPSSLRRHRCSRTVAFEEDLPRTRNKAVKLIAIGIRK